MVEGGGICLEDLHNDWNGKDIPFSPLFSKIAQLMVEGEGRIDLRSNQHCYYPEETKRGTNRMKGKYDW